VLNKSKSVLAAIIVLKKVSNSLAIMDDESLRVCGVTHIRNPNKMSFDEIMADSGKITVLANLMKMLKGTSASMYIWVHLCAFIRALRTHIVLSVFLRTPTQRKVIVP